MRHIFIASVGGAPQVVTETLWALMHPHKLLSADDVPREPVVPDEVIMLTTSFRGLGPTFKSKSDRLNTTRDKILELYKQYGHPVPKINTLKQQVVRDSAGKEIDDIRNINQNAAFADAITAIMARLKKRRKREPLTLHMSLAGGRKTMSSLYHAVMLYYGTEKDELTHVLVENTLLETASDFWWPDQKQATVNGYSAKEGKIVKLSTAAQMDAEGSQYDSAQLDLVTVPFDPLGRLIPDIDQRFATYEKLILHQRWERNSEPVVFHRRSRTISVSGEDVALSPATFAILFTLAAARKQNWTSPYDNQIAGLQGNVLTNDIRYGLDNNAVPRETRALKLLGQLFDEWEDAISWENRPDGEPGNFLKDTLNWPPPDSDEKELKTPFDGALGNLRKELKKKGKEHYFPAFLSGIGVTTRKKKISLVDGYEMSTSFIGLDVDPGRIKFCDD